MTAFQIFFYLIAAFTLIMAGLAVTTRKIFRSAIWLLFSLVGVAAFYFWIDIPFLAAVQTVVYVGGIVVLIIFSIFLTQQAGDEMPAPERKQQLFSILAVVCGAALAGHLVYHYQFHPAEQSLTLNMRDLGKQMLNTTDLGYALPFEAISILLLAAMIGCIVIAMRSRGEANKTNSTNVTTEEAAL